MKGKCQLCKSGFTGRKDKLFCTVKCKTRYNKDLIAEANIAAIHAEKILHRNRSILFEILGANTKPKKVNRKLLDQKKFNWQYITQTHTNVKGKLLNYVYDFSWMIFSDQEVLINKLKGKKL